MKNSIITKAWGGLLTALLLLGAVSASANFGGKVYCDANCNGVFDNGDAPLAGVTVNAYLCGTSTLVGSTVTAADGSYSFVRAQRCLSARSITPASSFHRATLLVPTQAILAS